MLTSCKRPFAHGGISLFAVCNKPLKVDKELSPNNMELHILIIIVTKKLHAINSVVDVSELLQGKDSLGPVVRRPISANPGLTQVSISFVQKHFFRIILSILFTASNHQIVDQKDKTEFAFKPSNLN